MTRCLQKPARCLPGPPMLERRFEANPQEPATRSAMVRRRHVFYIEGYDPQGPQGYYSLFQYAAARFHKLWPVELTIGKLQTDSSPLAHWTIEASTPNWQVSTRYAFLRLEDVFAETVGRPA